MCDNSRKKINSRHKGQLPIAPFFYMTDKPSFPWKPFFLLVHGVQSSMQVKDTRPPTISISPREAVLVTAHLSEFLWVKLNILLWDLESFASHEQLSLAGDHGELPMGHNWPTSFWHIYGKLSWVRTVLVAQDLTFTQATNFTSVILSKIGLLLAI